MSSQFNKFYKFLPFITIVIGISVSIFVGWFTYHYYEEKENSHLELASNEIVVLVEARMAAYEQVLRSGVGFFNASDSVSRNAWAIFVKDHKLNDNFKGIQGFGYSEVVFPQNKLVHEERIKKEGFADFKIHPDGQRELYTSIIYLEPFDERNIRAFGYDMFSEKVRREAMLKAMKSGEATLSGKITLVQEFDTNIQAGFLVYLPVYKKGSKLATPQDRVSATQGFVYATFRANDLMDGVLGTMFPHIHFEIFDGNLPTKQSILFDSNTNNEFTLVYKTTNLTINGHTWTLLFRTNSILESEDIYIVFIIPSFILILTLLLYLLLNSLIKTKENAVQIAKKATQKLQDSEERLRYALEGAGDGLWDWNLKTNEVFFSKRWKEMLGFAEDEIDSTLDEWKSRIHPEEIEQVYADITAHIEGKSDAYINEHRVKCKDDSYKWILDRGIIVSRDIDGNPVRMVGSHSDISERKQSQLRIEALSVTDRLTQLYNRLKLDEIFAMKLATAGRYNTPFSVVIIDIDLFKLVNDTWGHQAGDDVLKEFSAIIKNNARETDIVGRWGGEEFLILSSDTDLDGAIKLSEKLREMVSSFKFSFTGHKTASFGVSSYHAGDDEKTMIKRADDALYRAKENGRNRVEAEEYN
ncbi:GGDEF domain-containing protein [Candidatus Sulfurimonas baltica]|uniref:GGDEF domain-containing protein n=1 Tax=Candidatus Sulfurimonas baltica TaxID=2740404 RepID=UPI001E6109FA|nr:GGDEF domain-containing protein [Candidatus Sulfurimonas baltica]